MDHSKEKYQKLKINIHKIREQNAGEYYDALQLDENQLQAAQIQKKFHEIFLQYATMGTQPYRQGFAINEEPRLGLVFFNQFCQDYGLYPNIFPINTILLIFKQCSKDFSKLSYEQFIQSLLIMNEYLQENSPQKQTRSMDHQLQYLMKFLVENKLRSE